ncbi:MAG: hypothetical protein OEM63_09680, partial [Gammaproteobacteria bacterium]|nr:hypothetical protein [Gammaproteobacteria bacterium]
MKRAFAIPASALVALLLAGCGGGGGGGGPVPPPGLPATGTINSGSVLNVSGRSLDVVFQSSGFGAITQFVGLSTLSTSDPGGVRTASAAKPVGQYVNAYVPVGPDTSACNVSGTVTVTGDIANPLTVTPGDFLDYEWDDCDDGSGEVIDGFIGMTFTEFEGNLLSGQILLGVSLVVEVFRVVSGTDVNVTTGDLSLTIDSRGQPTTIISTLGSTLRIANGASTDTLSDFSVTVTEDASVFPNNFTTDAIGSVTSTLFSGTVAYNMPIPFESSGDKFPYKGE